MRVIEIERTGGPEELKVAERPTPRPGPGQALVRVAAAGVNFADTMQREGRYPVQAGFELPAVLGSEAAGVIEKLGPDTPGVVGTRVAVPLFMEGRLTGGYAEHVVADARNLVPIPDALDFEEATALQVQGLTAAYMLEQIDPADRTVLVHAAAGGVGSLLVQLAQARGARVIATASTAAKLEFARTLGADIGVNYAEPDWTERVLAETGGRGPDVIYDPVGGDVSRQSLELLAPKGILVVYGAQSLDTVALGAEEITRLIYRNQWVTGFALPTLLEEGRGPAVLADLFARTITGGLTVRIGGRYPFEEASEAHRALRARETTGKLVLVP